MMEKTEGQLLFDEIHQFNELASVWFIVDPFAQSFKEVRASFEKHKKKHTGKRNEK